jgi:hypothetical protein
MKRNIRGWIIAAVAAAVLILLLVLWGMRPGRQGQPGQPGQPGHDVKASVAGLVLADRAGLITTSWL